MPKSRPSDGMKLDVDLPQEDEFALSNYTTLSHYLFFFFPNEYKKFYSENIRFDNNRSLNWINDYHTIIQRIYGYTNKSKIIIKNPSNTARIKYLVKKYPNAKFIHIYRNPIFVYLSTYKFFYELFPSVNLQEIGENKLKELVIYNYREMYKDYFIQKKLIRKENLIEIPFEDFRWSPLRYVKRIYQDIDKWSLAYILEKIRKKVSCHVSGLPVPYRTTEEEPGFLNQTDHGCDCIPGGNAFPVALDNLYCNRYEMAEFAKECAEKKINFIGICCGAEPHHVREMAVALGRIPISYKYYPDMSKHYAHGTDSSLKKHNTDAAKTL